MKKPNALAQLLEELHGEAISSRVDANKESKVVIYMTEHDADKEDGITLSHTEAQLVLANENTVERFHESLGCPDDASLVLHDVTVPDRCLDALERLFAAVDEG